MGKDDVTYHLTGRLRRRVFTGTEVDADKYRVVAAIMAVREDPIARSLSGKDESHEQRMVQKLDVSVSNLYGPGRRCGHDGQGGENGRDAANDLIRHGCCGRQQLSVQTVSVGAQTLDGPCISCGFPSWAFRSQEEGAVPTTLVAQYIHDLLGQLAKEESFICHSDSNPWESSR